MASTRQDIKQEENRWPENLIRAYRMLRQLAYKFITPFDYVWLALNGKSDFPPLYLRRHVGPLRSFEMSGAEFRAYLFLICELRTGERMLDIGCGCGQMALQLSDYLEREGYYCGMDVHRPSIRWCQRNIGKGHRNFEFHHMDVRSTAYNPRGKQAAENYTFPFGDESFDLVLLKSVFTHMRPSDVANYLQEVSRLLSKNGRCLLTFFLLNEEQERLRDAGLNQLSFGFGNSTWRYVHQHSPESAIAYSEEYILSLLREHRLVLERPIMYGVWAGRKGGLSYQDILLLRKQ